MNVKLRPEFQMLMINFLYFPRVELLVSGSCLHYHHHVHRIVFIFGSQLNARNRAHVRHVKSGPGKYVN